MKNKIFLFLLLFCFIALSSEAQIFAPRILGFSGKKISYIKMKDGRQLEGYLKNVKLKKGLIKGIKFEDVGGAKLKINAEEIAEMRAAPSDLGKFASFLESTGSVNRMEGGDFSKVLKKDFVYFEQALLPTKKPTYVLLQLVNPGFDSKIKVFDDPKANESAGLGVGGVKVTGGILKSYYIVKGGVALRIKKGQYEDMFATVFGDCPYLEQNYQDKKYQDFAEHVFAHEQKCD